MTGEIAHVLRNVLGLQAGDRVAIVSPNSTIFVMTFLAIARAGLTSVPLNPLYSPEELAHPLEDSDVRVVLAHPVAAKSVLACLEKMKRKPTLPNGQPSVWLLDDGDKEATGPAPLKDLRSQLSKEQLPVQKIGDSSKTPVTIVYSSGTSGKPKGVMLAHDALIANTETVVFTAQADFHPGNTIGAVLPMFHIFGINVLLLSPLLVGIEIVVLPRFDIEMFCAMVQRFKVAFVLVVPPMLLMLARSPAVNKYDLSSLRVLLSGAAPLSPELGDEVERRLPNVRVTQGYGLSETAPILTVTPSNEYHNFKGSCGEAAYGVELRLVTDDDKDVAFEQGANGNPGELWARGRNIMMGYVNNKEATDDCLTDDGWFKTGDIAILRNNHFYIVDRKKELIKYKGFQVPPAELEALILTHPQVADVAVVGLQSKQEATELPLAFVVPRSFDASSAPQDKKDALSKDVIEWVGQRVANHKKLRGGVRIIPAIPKNASGKILRRELRDSVNPK